MWGLAEVAFDDPKPTAVLLACASLVCIGESLEETETIEYLRAANEIAAQRGARVPSDFLIEASTALELAGIFSYSPAEVARLRTNFPGPDGDASSAF